MPNWLTQLVIKANNPQRALEKVQKLEPLVFKGDANPLQAEE